jgi:hypothetical protein
MKSGLAEAWAEFRAMPLRRHLAGVALVALLLAARFAGALFASGPIQDEEVYAAAFEKAQQGESPYAVPQFYYLPPFAGAGALVAEKAGMPATLAVLRAANLLAAAGLIWLATGCWRLSFVRRVGVAAIYGAVAPAIDLALAWGNLSPLAILPWLAAFLLWRRRPILAGAAYALAMLVKPLAAIGIGLLALHRPEQKERRPQIWAGATAAILLLATILPSPNLKQFFGLSAGIPTAARSASLQRLLYCFGIEISALVLMATVFAVALVLLRRKERNPAELYAFAVIAGLLATPLVWSHTLLLVLPLQSAALALAWQRRERVELMTVTTAVLAIQLSNGLGGIEKWPLPVQGLFVLLPCFAPLGLGLYLATRLEER